MTRMDLVSVLREDPALARPLEPARVEMASREALARVVSVPKGIFWPHEALPAKPATLGMLVLEGLLLRGVAVADRPTVEVFGAGDLVRPFESGLDPHAVVPAEVRWWGLRPARLAVLDASFTRRMSAYPEVIAELAGRLWCASAATSVRLSIVRQPRLSARLHFMLWHLADRFGRVQPDGVVLALPLCHSLLSWLVGAQRPAVCRALKELDRAGLVARRADKTWWLARQAPEGLADLTLAARRVAA